MVSVSSQFDGQLVAQGAIDDGQGGLYVIRGLDPRRHIVVATRGLRKGHVVLVSMEASAHDPVEVGDEWTVLERLYDSVTGVKPRRDEVALELAPFSEDDRLRFDLPPGVYIGQWAYGMAQLRERGRRDLGRMFYGALAATDGDACLAAMERLAEDDALSEADVAMDGPDAVIDAWLTDRRGVTSNLVAGCRPVGRGVALLVATLLLEGDDESRIFEILTHTVETAEVFGRSRKPRAPTDAAEVLAPIDSFRHRV